MAEPAIAPSTLDDFAKQEIRVAAVLNGGVSLAVWMSGVTIELHHLAMASSGMGWRPYANVLDQLGATACVDVIAGTSAGGLNGAFLALGISRRRDLGLLRDLWAEGGSLDRLLRKPLAKNPPSALDGDGYFLAKIQDALTQMAAAPDLGDRDNPVALKAVELILTGTLWSGRQTRFTDDMGVGITERDYNAMFRFSSDPSAAAQPVGDLHDSTDEVLNQLASAARCTSSFPAAFEPHYVQVGAAAMQPGQWASTAGQANFDASQYVIDGGVLLNKPLRPAIDAIYQQTAENQVRRVLAYVVPDPGEEPTPTPTKPDQQVPDVPVATDVLLGVLTRLTSTDSVSRELSEIRDTNASVREHRRARARLSTAIATAQAADPGAGAGQPTAMARALWNGYISERIDGSSATIARLVAEGQLPGETAWSVQELTAGLARVGSGQTGFGFVPRGTIEEALAATGADWTWGQTTLVRLADMTVDLLKRAVLLAPVSGAAQQRLVDARGALKQTLDGIALYNDDLNRFWVSKGVAPDRPLRALPVDPDDVHGFISTGSATNIDKLDGWLAEIVTEWDGQFGGDDGGTRRAEQYTGAVHLAAGLLAVGSSIAEVLAAPNLRVDPTGDERSQLSALYTWLLPEAVTEAEVLRRMLELDVVLVATSGALAQPEQEVELVQISCADRNNITGMQLHHFGAFYRKPWRINDWIEGRMDGSRQVMRLLLHPERLRQRGFVTSTLLEAMHGVAVPSGSPDREWLETRWRNNLGHYQAEADLALQSDAPDTSLDLLSEAVAMPLRLAALREDLDALAEAVRAERSDAQAGSHVWLGQYDNMVRTVPKSMAATPAASLTAGQLWELRKSMGQIGAQKITDDVGSDNFARTVSHAAVVATGAFTAKTDVKHVKAVRLVISALRGYVALVYSMVAYITRGSVIGTRLVELAVAAGGVLLAVTIFVPGVPLGLTLAGVLLLLAGASASALLTRGARGMGVRALIAVLLVGGSLGYLIWRDVDKYGFHGQVVSVSVKVGIGLLIVLLGWFIANGGFGRAQSRKPGA